jgi:hypothetical protein
MNESNGDDEENEKERQIAYLTERKSIVEKKSD